SLTDAPVGMNALIEQSSRKYHERMSAWIDIALEEGVRFFVTSLGKPRWVVDRVSPHGGVVYHDVTERKWAEKGLESGVTGLIAVNRRAGGHAGPRSAEALIEELGPLGVPVVCAGGIGTPDEFAEVFRLGYAGAQLGTRFIATDECAASDAYKRAIVSSGEDDVVLSEKLTGVPVAVLNTPYIQRMGLEAGPVARRLLRGRRTKHWMRLFYTVKSFFQLKRSLTDEKKEFWQAGKSVAGIHGVEPAGDIVRRFEEAIEA
ncbi:MAG: nitronate monooxygenase, partial [Gemmatimonadota bacterium]|nr:nitronate monooxygenase [Gemmatimonadota bacterium]